MTYDSTPVRSALDALDVAHLVDVDAAVANAEAGWAADRAQLQAKLDGALAHGLADDATIADLRARLDAILHPIHWGMNAVSTTQHDQVLAMLGPGPITFRYYQRPGQPVGWPTEYALRPGDEFCYSDKVPPGRLTVADCVSLYQRAPTDGRKFRHCPWHESENDIERGAFSAADFRSLYPICREAQQRVGNPNVILPVIMMGYDWQKGSGRNPLDYIPPQGTFDEILVDTYFAGNIGQGVDHIPTAFDAPAALAADLGVRFGVAETGIGQKVTGQTRKDALKLLSSTIKQKGASLGLYFATSEKREWAMDADDVTYWKAGQAA